MLRACKVYRVLLDHKDPLGHRELPGQKVIKGIKEIQELPEQ